MHGVDSLDAIRFLDHDGNVVLARTLGDGDDVQAADAKAVNNIAETPGTFAMF